jgi:nucleoid DNA-binding protein
MKSMKAGAAKAMTKGALLKAIAAEQEGMKTKDCSKVLNSLVTFAAKEVKKFGVFTIPGICRIKTRSKPATKACTKMIFGKETKVKAKPAKTVVKAFPVAALKSQI